MTEHKDIEHALLAIYKEVGYVQKTGEVSVGRGYKYAGESDLIAAIRPAMIRNGVTVRRSNVDNVDIRLIEKRKWNKFAKNLVDEASFLITTVETYVFSHATSGTKVEVQSIGSGHDSLDKAAFKAMTGAYKYALRNTFCIETGDDPDKEMPKAEQQRTANEILERISNAKSDEEITQIASDAAHEMKSLSSYLVKKIKEKGEERRKEVNDLSPHTEDQFPKSKAEKVRQEIIEKINNFDNCTDLNAYEREVKAEYGDKLNVTHWNAITDAFANRGLSLADAGLL